MDKRNYSRREFWKDLLKRFSLLILGMALIKQSGRTGLKEAQFYKRGDCWAG